MRNLVAALLAIALSLPAFAERLRIVDDAGRTVLLPRPAQRIISIAPHITELLFAAGAGDRIVGADEFSDYPLEAKALPRIGRHSSLDLEAIVALKPDIVIGWESGNRMPQLDQLERLGIPLYLNEIRSIGDIARSIEGFGTIAGTGDAAHAAAAALRARTENLATQQTTRIPLRVFYQIWNRPLMTVSGKHLISEAIERCGGRNVFAGLAQLAPTISIESVLAANPDVILASGADADRPEWLDDWKRWPELAAVGSDSLYAIPPDILQRPTPRFIDGVEAVCAALERTRTRSSQAR